MKKLIFALAFLTAAAYGQIYNPSIIPVATAPSGPCTNGLPNQQVTSTGIQYSCQGGTWGAFSTSTATGTVTQVTGTTNQIDVATGTTTPVISIDSAYSPAQVGTTNFSASQNYFIVGAPASASGNQALGQSGNIYYNPSTGLITSAFYYSYATTGTVPYGGSSTTLNPNLNAGLFHGDSTIQGTITSGVGLFGASAINTVLAGTLAAQAGHFTNLNIIAVLGGTCTTLPQFNVFDGTSNTGTALAATATTQTKGQATTQAQTLTFAAGDQIGIYVSTAGGTCTTDQFTVTAQYSTP